MAKLIEEEEDFDDEEVKELQFTLEEWENMSRSRRQLIGILKKEGRVKVVIKPAMFR